MNGLDHIRQTFQKTRQENRAALMPYFTLGFPTIPLCLDVISALAGSGADLIELGIPFSDPLADGPTIQHSSQIALENGITVSETIHLVHQLRDRGVSQPFMLMGYYNPIIAYGIQSFVADAAGAGADGLIIPDLPPEEAVEIEAACQKNGLSLIFLLAPTSTTSRVKQIVDHSTSFVYLVSLTGVTGARDKLSANLSPFIQSVRAQTQLPLAVGFGISTPSQVEEVGKMADGVIIGSALVQLVEQSDNPVQTAADYIHKLRHALSPNPNGGS